MSRFVRFCLMALIAAMCLTIFVTRTDAVPLEMTQDVSEATTTTEKSHQECSEGYPCGWGVYGTNKGKKIKYFMKNTCFCSKEHKCLLSNEDLSLTAFVYRCKPKTSDQD